MAYRPSTPGLLPGGRPLPPKPRPPAGRPVLRPGVLPISLGSCRRRRHWPRRCADRSQRRRLSHLIRVCSTQPNTSGQPTIGPTGIASGRQQSARFRHGELRSRPVPCRRCELRRSPSRCRAGRLVHQRRGRGAVHPVPPRHGLQPAASAGVEGSVPPHGGVVGRATGTLGRVRRAHHRLRRRDRDAGKSSTATSSPSSPAPARSATTSTASAHRRRPATSRSCSTHPNGSRSSSASKSSTPRRST